MSEECNTFRSMKYVMKGGPGEGATVGCMKLYAEQEGMSEVFNALK